MVKIQEVIPRDEIKVHKTKVEQISEQMSAIKVTSKEALTQVAGHIAQVKETKKIIKAVRDKYIAPAQQIIDQAKTDFNPIMDMCDEVEAVLKKKAEVFMLAEKKREDDAKAKEIAKVESGYQKPETAVAKMGEIKKAETSVKTEKGSLSMAMVDEVIVFDASLIPEEYYKPRELDMVKINKVAKAGIAIPGVKVEKKPQMGMRAR